MTIYAAVFSLLKEALFNQKSDNIQYPSEDSFWRTVYNELQNQAVLGLASVAVPNHKEVPIAIKKGWDEYQRLSVVQYVQMYAAQTEAIDLLRQEGVAVAVMKGLAAACYYPIPEHRTMGDIDLIVKPENYFRSIKVLKNNGFLLVGEEGARYHTAFIKYGIIFELHQSPASIHKDPHGETIKKYILSGLDFVEINHLGPDQFPILPWKQNGMELIWHIRQHLYNGLGLRHIIDWMMFVNYTLDDEHIKEYKEDLDKCGLYQLALHITKLCQKYLGLRKEGITWCNDANDNVCDELLAFIMGQGNFGKKKGLNDKTAKVISGYSNLSLLIGKLQEVGESEWQAMQEFSLLKPVAWAYGGIKAIRLLFKNEGGVLQAVKNVNLGRRRKALFKYLYDSRDNRAASYIKQASHLPIGNVLGYIYDFATYLEYKWLNLLWFMQGYRLPTKEEKEYVRRNITFIFKSFERQKMARALCESIHFFYPGVRIIVTDDSRKPLIIERQNVTVVQLPFNSGLGYGLQKALEKVETPYVMRMDDDELLTMRSQIHRELVFLKEHGEVDLIGFGVRDGLRPSSIKNRRISYFSQKMKYAPLQLKVKHATQIDKDHIVLAKVANVYLVRTEKLRKVGYDSRIHILDHDDFFRRAAGVLVSVLSIKTVVYHRHNYFIKDYMEYRNDIQKDIVYIKEKVKKSN